MPLAMSAMALWPFLICCFFVQALLAEARIVDNNNTFGRSQPIPRHARAASSGPSLFPDTLRFLDDFNDPDDYPHHGGQLSIMCDVNNADDRATCAKETLHLLSPSNKPLSPTPCGAKPVPMKLTIDETTELGEYRCVFKGQKSEHSFQLAYRLCKPNPEIAQDSKCLALAESEGLCITTAKTNAECVKLDKNRCLSKGETDTVLCPGNRRSCEKAETKSLAKLYSKECPTHVPKLVYGSDVMYFNTYAPIKPSSAPLQFHLLPSQNLINSNLTCSIRKKSAVLETKKLNVGRINIYSEVAIDFAYKPSSDMGILKITCELEKDSKKLALFAFHLVAFPDVMSDSPILKSVKDAKGKPTYSCTLQSHVPGEFITKTDFEVQETVKGGTDQVEATMYMCRINVTYTAPSPLTHLVVAFEKLLVIAEKSPILDEKDTRILDEFGDESSIAYDGGRIIVQCRAPVASLCMGREVYEIVDESNQPISSEICNASQGAAFVQLPINNGLKLGKYKCRYGGRLSDAAVNIQYRICAKEGPLIKKDSCDSNNAYCIVTAKETSPCGKMQKEFCPSNKEKKQGILCPGNILTLCHAEAEGTSAFAKIMADKCPEDGHVPHIEQASTSMAYNSHLEVSASKPDSSVIAIIISEGSEFAGADLTCLIKDRNRVIHNVSEKASGRTEIKIPDDILGTFQFCKVICDLRKNGALLASLSNFVVILPEAKLVIERGVIPEPDGEESSQSNHGIIELHDGSNSLVCRLSPQPTADFAIESNFTAIGSADQKSAGKEYSCKMDIIYLSLAPVLRIMTSANTTTRILPDPPTLNRSSVKIYDAYADEVSMIYYGGHVVLECVPNEMIGCNSNDDYQLIGPQNVAVAHGKCDPKLGAASLRVDIDESFKFGVYHCAQSELVSHESVGIWYRLCTGNDQASSESCDPQNDKKRPHTQHTDTENPFCTFNGTHSLACQRLHSGHCLGLSEFKDYVMCPSAFAERFSYCTAMVDSQSEIPKARIRGHQCPDDADEVPAIEYPAEKTLRSIKDIITHKYKSVIKLDRRLDNPTEFGFNVANTSFLVGATLVCVIKKPGGEILDQKPTPASSLVFITFNESILSEGTITLKLICKYLDPEQAELAVLVNYLVNFHIKSNATIRSIPEEDGRLKKLVCELDPPPASNDFVFEYKWTIVNKDNHNTSVLEVGVGDYQCIMNVYFVWPSPMSRILLAENLKARYRIENEIITTSTAGSASLSSTSTTRCPDAPKCPERTASYTVTSTSNKNAPSPDPKQATEGNSTRTTSGHCPRFVQSVAFPVAVALGAMQAVFGC